MNADHPVWGRGVAAVFLLSLLIACGGGGGSAEPPTVAAAVPASIAPSITSQPASRTVVAGSPATFAVAATGDAALNYQWLRNGVEVSGATQPAQTIAAASLVQDSGSRWSVRVANNAGSVTSAEAVLTVMPAPVPLGISLTAGTPSGTGALDGKGRAAYFNQPAGIAFDAAGTAYVSETSNRTIRKVTADGTVSTIAGVSGSSGSQDGTGSQALFGFPGDLAMGSDGALYLIDTGKLRRVTIDGVVTTLTAPARLVAVASSTDGGVYLATGTAVYRIVPGFPATLVAGQEGVSSSIDGIGASAAFFEIGHLAVDAASTIYVSQPRTHTIRRITADGAVTTFAGVYASLGSVDGNGAAARFSTPGALALDASGFLWVAETGSGRFRKVSAAGDVTTPYGAGRGFFSNSGAPPVPLAIGPGGDLYFGVGAGISRIDPAGVVTPLAGQDFPTGSAIGPVGAMAVDSDGNIAVSSFDLRSQSLQLGKYTSGGERLGFQVTVPTPARAFVFTPVEGLGADAQGNLYVSSFTSKGGGFSASLPTGGAISRVAPDGTVSTLVSWPGGSADAFAPEFLRVGRDGAVYFVDVFTNNLVKWAAGAGATVIANLGPPTSLFSQAEIFIAADAAGKVYVVKNNVVQRVENGTLVIVAGAVGAPGTTDGAGAQARFLSPSSPVADAAGNLYLADREVIRKVTPEGIVTTVAGQRGGIGVRAGALPGNLGIVGPMAIGPDGVLYLISSNALVKIRLP